MRVRGARLLFLPQCSPDLNPIEMALSKLKVRAAAARTFDNLLAALGNVCALFTPQECSTYPRSRRIRTRLNLRRFNAPQTLGKSERAAGCPSRA